MTEFPKYNFVLDTSLFQPIGIAVGCVLCFLIIVVITFCCIRNVAEKRSNIAIVTRQVLGKY